MSCRRGWRWLPLAMFVAACGLADTGPIALDDRIVVAPGATIVHDVLANDRAPTGGSLILDSASGGRGSTVVLDDRRVEYTAPTTGETDSFIYVAVSGAGVIVEARVDVTIVIDDSIPPTTASATTIPATTTPTSGPSTTAVESDPPSVDPPEVDFGPVAVGAIARRTVTLIAGDEPWTPRFDEFDLIPDVRVDATCGDMAPGARCETAVIWNPSESDELDRTPRLPGDVPLRVFGTATNLLLEPADQEVPVLVGADRSTTVSIAILAPGPDPVDIVEIVTQNVPDGTAIDPTCRVVEGSCTFSLTVPTETFTTGPNPPVGVVIRTSANEIRGSLTFVGTLAPPEWLTPSNGQHVWIGEIARGMTVSVDQVPGAQRYRVVGAVCGGDDCLEMVVTEQGSETFLVTPPDPAEVRRVFGVARNARVPLTLRLTATAISSDVESLPSTIEIVLEDDALAATLVDHRPDPLARCGRLTTTLLVTSWFLGPESVVARHGPEVSNPVEVRPGTRQASFIVDEAEPFQTIDLLANGVTHAAIDRDPDFVVPSCPGID